MNLQIYVLPETVSFSGIAMEEIPSVSGTHQGYFANEYFSNVWYHTVAMGAGMWTNVKPDNFWDEDRVWMGDELPRVVPNGTMTFDVADGAWHDGVLVWNINWGWSERNRESGDEPEASLSSQYSQSFVIDENGTLAVSKFQNEVSRGTNNVIRLNGDILRVNPITKEKRDVIKDGN